MAIPSPLSRRQTVAALLTLTVVTGLVDAVSYLRLGRVFVANMTGNVVFLGLSVDPHSGLSAAASIIAIGGFVVGAFGAGWAAAHLAHRPRQWLGSALAVEAVVLGVVAVLTGVGALPFVGSGRFATIVLLSLALGVQNGTIRHFAVPDLTTTVLTMSLTGLSADNALAGGSGAKTHRRAGSVVAMLAGAAVGAALLQLSAPSVIAIAAGLVAVIAAFFWAGREHDGKPVDLARSRFRLHRPPSDTAADEELGAAQPVGSMAPQAAQASGDTTEPDHG
jgi:uncharacterized membrane protein YoaK (UPF0700 family)